MSKLIKPEGYKALLDMKHTEQGIKQIKDFFQQNLSTELRLSRVTAPLFVLQGLGINDDLNGVERAVSFPIKDLGEQRAEVVHSLAKWKRLTLAEYEIEPDHGIYTDMNAIRADEELDNLHSLYVDQTAISTISSVWSRRFTMLFFAQNTSPVRLIRRLSHSFLVRYTLSTVRNCSRCTQTSVRRSVRMPSVRSMVQCLSSA